MTTHYRRTKLERYIKQLEAKRSLYITASFGSEGYGKLEMVNEVLNELRHEFNLKEDEGK